MKENNNGKFLQLRILLQEKCRLPFLPYELPSYHDISFRQTQLHMKGINI